MQYNPMHLIQGGGPRQGVYVQQAMAGPGPRPGVFIQQSYQPGGGYMTNYPQTQQMLIQQPQHPEMMREPPVRGPIPAEIVRAQQMQNLGPVLAAPQPQQLMSTQPVFVRTPNGIHIQQMAMGGEEYMKSPGAHVQPNQVQPPYLTPQRNDQLQPMPNPAGNNSNNAQFVSTIQGIPLYSPDAQANLHVLSPPQQGQQYLIEHSPVQLAHPPPQYTSQQQQATHNIATQHHHPGGSSIYIVPNAENASQGPSLLSPCATTANNRTSFTTVTPALNHIQAPTGAVLNSLAGLSSPVQTIPQIQSIPNNAAPVVQTMGTITMVTCGGNLNTAVMMPMCGIPSQQHQATIPGVASVNIVSASQRPVCSVNLVNQTPLQPQSSDHNVLPGIGSLMTAVPASQAESADLRKGTRDSEDPARFKLPHITLLKTETMVLTTTTQNSGDQFTEVKVRDNVVDTPRIPSKAEEVTEDTHPQNIVCADVMPIIVPYGWRREIEDDVIVYYSPSGTVLHSHEEVCTYITTENTCKCGLLCPLRVETSFNFDVAAMSKPWTLEDTSCNNDLTKLCEHKHKIVTMATLQNSAQLQQFGSFLDQEPGKEKSSKKGSKKKKKKPRQLSPELPAGTAPGQMEAPFASIHHCVPEPASTNTDKTQQNSSLEFSVSEKTETTGVAGCVVVASSSQTPSRTVILEQTGARSTAGLPGQSPSTGSSATSHSECPSSGLSSSPGFEFRPPAKVQNESHYVQNHTLSQEQCRHVTPGYTVQSSVSAAREPGLFPVKTVQRCLPGHLPAPSQNSHPGGLQTPQFTNQPNSMGQVLYPLAAQQGQQMSFVQSPPPGSFVSQPSHHIEHASKVSPSFYKDQPHPEEHLNFNTKWNNGGKKDKLKKKRTKKNKKINGSVLKPTHIDEAIESVARGCFTDSVSVQDEKEEGAAFLENPTLAFMAQQTAIVNSSLPGTSPPHKPQVSTSLSQHATGATTAIVTTSTATQKDSEIVKLLNAPTPKKKSKSTEGLSNGTFTLKSPVQPKETIDEWPSGLTENSAERTRVSDAYTACTSPQMTSNLCNEKKTVDHAVIGQMVGKRGKHKPEPIDTSGSLAENSVSLSSPPIAMSTPKMSIPMALGHQSPLHSPNTTMEEMFSSATISAGPVVTSHEVLAASNIAMSSAVACSRMPSLQPPSGVLHGRYRLGNPAGQSSPEQKAFPASQMLTAAARAQAGSGGTTQMYSPPSGAGMLVQQRGPTPPNSGHHPRIMSPPHPHHGNSQGYPGFAPGHPQQTNLAPRLGLGAMYRGQRFATVGPPGPQQMMQAVAPPGEWQQNRMMFVERPMRAGMPPMQPGPAFTGPRGSQKSPIQMVQNMIYGLQASQNALAVAMQPEVPNKRRRKSTSSDGSGRSSARPNSVSSLEFGGQQMLYEGVQYPPPFHPHQQAMMEGQMFFPANPSMQAAKMQATSESQIMHSHPMQQQQQQIMQCGSGGILSHPNMVMQAPPTGMQAPPPGLPPAMQMPNQMVSGYMQIPQLQQPQQVMASCVAMETGVNNSNLTMVLSQPQFDPVESYPSGVTALVQQQEEAAVSEMLPSITAMPSMSVAVVTAVTDAISEVISTPAVLSQPGQQLHTAPVNCVEANQLSVSENSAVSSSPPVMTPSASATPAAKPKKQWKKKKKTAVEDNPQPVLTGTIAKILESAKREMEAQKQQPPDQRPANSKPNTSASHTSKNVSPCKHSNAAISQKKDHKDPGNEGNNTNRMFESDRSSYCEEDKASKVSEQDLMRFSNDYCTSKNCDVSTESSPFCSQSSADLSGCQSDSHQDIDVNAVDISNVSEFSKPESDHQTCDIDTKDQNEPSFLFEQDDHTMDSDVNSRENDYDDIPDESDDSDDNHHFIHYNQDDGISDHDIDPSIDVPPDDCQEPSPPPSMLIGHLYPGHIDLLSTSYAIRTPRVFTSAKARSAARILRKARKGGMRKIKRSFPGQLGGNTSPNTQNNGAKINGNAPGSGKARTKLKPRCIDKNFNSCSPSDKNFHEDLLSDDNDSATHSHSEMDTSRCSQSSDTSTHTEVNDPATDDSGINCEHHPTTDTIKPKAIGAKRNFQPQEEDSRERLSRGKFSKSFNVGDLVWGESRGFPSWPGKLVHESDVKGHYNGAKLEQGKLWVRWFGNHTFAQVEPGALKTLSEGLEAHHRERQHFRKGRKLTRNLDDAIQEAMGELDRPTPAEATAPEPTTDIPAHNRVKLVKKKKR